MTTSTQHNDLTDASDEAFDDVLARIERRPEAHEAFHHSTTCQATPDALGLCECPPTVPDLRGILPKPPAPRPLVPGFLTSDPEADR